MSSSQPGHQAQYSGRFPSGHLALNDSHAESSSAAAQNSGQYESAPRSRSSTFGQSSPTPLSQPPQMPVSFPTYNLQPVLPQQSGTTGSVQQGQSVRPRSTTPQTPHNAQSIFHDAPAQSQSQSVATTRPPSSSITGNSGKSHFTSPITSPPRNRPNQILLINPSSTSFLTTALLTTLRPILPHGLELTAYTSPYPSPTAIESSTDAILSSDTCLRDLSRHSTNNGETVQNFDALLVCSYGKHPLIDSLRESYDVPVVGIMEASLYVARMLGSRFGIITPNTRAKVGIDDAVHAYGLSHFFIGVESLHVSSLALVDPESLPSLSSPTTINGRSMTPSQTSTSTRPKDDLHKRITVISRALVAKGADTIILGSEFLSTNEHIRMVKDAVREDDGRRTVNVIDAVEAGVMMLNGLVGMGVPTSKRGFYRSEREARATRGQTYI